MLVWCRKVKALSKTKKERYFPLFVVSLLYDVLILVHSCLYILLYFTSRYGTTRIYCVFSFY